jgi:hypothetical protein
MAEQIYTGYADADAPAHRGWVLGHLVSHSWEAEEDSTILGVRWPSVPGY